MHNPSFLSRLSRSGWLGVLNHLRLAISTNVPYGGLLFTIKLISATLEADITFTPRTAN